MEYADENLFTASTSSVPTEHVGLSGARSLWCGPIGEDSPAQLLELHGTCEHGSFVLGVSEDAIGISSALVHDSWRYDFCMYP
jgi:hypothetical protein